MYTIEDGSINALQHESVTITTTNNPSTCFLTPPLDPAVPPTITCACADGFEGARCGGTVSGEIVESTAPALPSARGTPADFALEAGQMENNQAWSGPQRRAKVFSQRLAPLRFGNAVASWCGCGGRG